MIQEIEAVYEHGLLRPLTPVLLTELQRVKLTISALDGDRPRDMALLERARAEVAAMKRFPAIEEVRAMLAEIPGSLAEDVIAERGEY